MTLLPITCRSCGSGGLTSVLSLGSTPLANALLTAEQLTETEATYPLELAFCPACSLVQLTESVSPVTLFRDYLYFSSFSDTMLRHSRELAKRLMKQRCLDGTSLVVELASNDGYLLQNYKRAGVPVLGVEPAVNIARVAEDRGIPTLSEFFGRELARRLAAEGKHADVIHANNVLAHVPDLNGFVAGIAELLKDDGVAVIEAPYVIDLIDHVEFDTIYHEHLCYFSLTALDALFRRHGLEVVDVEHVPIHGGSLRVSVGREGVYSRGGGAHPSVRTMLAEEAEWGVAQLGRYADFGSTVERLRDSLRSMLYDLKSRMKRIAAYGASAKGSTLLNYCRIGADVLDFVVDRSTVKQGHYTPGTHLRILPPEELLDAMPDYVLLLTWNFADEILGQQGEYLRRGGRFIVPVPEPRVVSVDDLGAVAH